MTNIPLFCPKGNLSLRCRLQILLGGMLLVTLLVIGTVVIYFVFENEHRAWQGRQGEATRYASEILASFLERAQNALIMVSLLEQDDLAAEPRVMDDLLQQSPALLELIRLDDKGHVLASSYRDAPLLANLFTIPQSRWFLQSQAGQLYLGDVQIAADSEPYLIVALPAVDSGVVAARLRMNLLEQVVSNLRFGESGHAYVIDQQGSIVVHSNPAVLVTSTSLAGRPELEAILGSAGQDWSGSYTNFEGSNVVGVASAVPGTKWVVVTELPNQEAFATTRTAPLLFGGGMVVFGVLVMLVMRRLLGQAIIDPVDRLRIGAERIGEGDLSYRLDVRRRDEVGQVAAAFNQMAAHLEEQQSQLERRNIQLEQMYQTSLSLTSNLDLKTVLDIILESTFKLLPELGDVHLFLYQAHRLKFAASLWADGRKDDLMAEPRPGGLTYSVAQQGEIIVVSDIRHDPLYQNAPSEWAGAVVGVPLKIGSQVVGVMNVGYGQPHHVPEQELRVLRLLGDQAAIAIQNARLYEQAQQELADRRRAENALRTLNKELERRVAARTEELTETNQELLHEITQRKVAEKHIKASLHEKEVLLKEIHHRVKNNLQVISSLLNLQSGYLEDKQALEILKDSQNRVRSMALIHEKLYRSENLAQIDFGEYIQELAAFLFRSQNAQARGITLSVQTDDIFLDIDAAMPCALIVNELVSNTLKHAFPNGQQNGKTVIKMHAGKNQHLTLEVADNGVGFPQTLDFRDTESLGLQLVNTLVNQLDGEIELHRQPRTKFSISFPYSIQSST